MISQWGRNYLDGIAFIFTTASGIGYPSFIVLPASFRSGEFQSKIFFLWLTLYVAVAVHLQVNSGQAQFVGVLRRQILGRLLRLLYCVAHTKSTAHRGHLPIELFPGDLVVKTQPAELDLHPKGTHEELKKVKVVCGPICLTNLQNARGPRESKQI